MRQSLAKFGLHFEKATPIVHFPKALKRPRNYACPAGIGLLIMKGIGLLIRKGIGLLIRKGKGLLIKKGIGLLIRKGIRILSVKYCFSLTMSRTLSKFSLPFNEATTLVHFPKTLKRPRNNAGSTSEQM